MSRRQLPPQIAKVSVTNRRTRKPEIRYQLTVDIGPDPDTGKRRQIRRRLATEKEARDELAKVLGGVTTGTYVATNKLTVDQACEDWLTSKHSLKPSTLVGHRSKLAALRDELGHMEVQKLTKAHLDDLVGRLRRGEVEGRRKKWSPRSCNYLLHLATAILDAQVRQGNVVRNVAGLVDRVAADPRTYRTLTDAEMFKILDHDCSDRHLWALALYGLRRGEVAGLRWSNVDLKAKTVTIVENRVTIPKEVLTGTPKSKASNRTLPMPDEVVDLLKIARKRQTAQRLAFGEGYRPGEHVACDESGQPIHPDTLTSRWGYMLIELGIPRVRLHDARHSCATLMHLRHVPIAVIAAWLGHANAAFTMSVYAHSQADALKDAATSFGRVVTTCDTETGQQG